MPQTPLEKAADWLDFPDGVLPSQAHLEIFGNRRILLDGNCDVTECGEDLLVLTVGKTTLRFRGRELCLAAFDRQSAVLEGRLSSIEFE